MPARRRGQSIALGAQRASSGSRPRWARCPAGCPRRASPLPTSTPPVHQSLCCT